MAVASALPRRTRPASASWRAAPWMRAAASVTAVNGTAIDTDASGNPATVHASIKSAGAVGVVSVSPNTRP